MEFLEQANLHFDGGFVLKNTKSSSLALKEGQKRKAFLYIYTS